VFIADITPTTTVKTDDGRVKKVPNANVLVEVGAAALTGKGWDRIVLVMNTTKAMVDELPFDLRHRQCQVTYALGDWEDGQRAEKAKQLTDAIILQLRPMYKCCRDLGGKDFTHDALVLFHMLYISLRQTLIGWDSVGALTLDNDRVRKWADAINAHFAGLCYNIIEELGSQNDQRGISELLSGLFADIKNVSRPFIWNNEKEEEQIADAARSYVDNYERFAQYAKERGLRLIPSGL
jgi:hypothetical protein